ncbi:RHS repeat-associated core domain-containing protein, partial [Puteibacter caeruleilacunae]
NGNIGSVVWKAHGESKKGYGYAYDGLNRLKKADFEVNVSTNVWSSANNFDVTGGVPKGIDYDIRGNIKSLKRYGNSSSYENDLVYTYSGNQLASIQDNAKGINGSYSYDTNGNMTKDGYRGFDVAYNRQNLPKKVSKGNDVVDYFYTADGTKVMKQTTKGGNTTRVSYAGSFVYQGDELDYIITSEGIYKGNKYQYNLKDYLGNTRVVIDQAGTIISKSDYYPFGKLHDRQSVDFVKNKYLYNGKEIQDEQLGGVLLDWYDYGARMYDAEIGRWHCIDPMAEDYLFLSPYNYVADNPISFIDIEGMKIGNPKSESAKSFESYMKKSKIGRRLWRKMKRVRQVFWFKNQLDNPRLNQFMISVRGKAASLSQVAYENAVTKGEGIPFKEKDGFVLHFDKKSGLWKKDKEAYSNVYIIFSEDLTQASANVGNEDPIEACILAVVEEAVHSVVQKKLDYTPLVKTRKKGSLWSHYEKSYVPNDYLTRRHEVSAKDKAKKALEQYRKERESRKNRKQKK